MSEQIKVRRNCIVGELTKELYHNPAVLEICESDDMVVDAEDFDDFCHDMGVIFVRALRAAVIHKTEID